MSNGYTHRHMGFVKTGLIGLHMAKYLRNDGGPHLFVCNGCGREIPRTKLSIHFAIGHKDILNMISNLIEIWGLTGSKSVSDLDFNEENEISIEV